MRPSPRPSAQPSCPHAFEAGPSPRFEPGGRRRSSARRAVVTGLSLALLATGGCASGKLDGAIDVDRLGQLLRNRGVDPQQVVLPYGLTDEMRDWANETAPRHEGDLEQLRLLRERLLDPDEMSMEYSWGYTGTAAEVFRQRKANCLAFTNLFVGMAREVGVEVYFMAVENVERFRREGDLVVISDHIAVGYGEGPSRKIFDFSESPNLDHRRVRKVSDLEALGMFHSNRGAEALQAGAVDVAVEWLELAVAIDPKLANAWVNYGVALRRAGLRSSAERAYKEAIARDPRTYSAYHNLAALLRSQNRGAEAAAYEETLAQSPSHNPYTYLSLGDISLRAGQMEDAERYYRRAVSLADDDHGDAYAALGQLAMVNGDLRLARKMLRKAQNAVEPGERVAILAQSLAPGNRRPGS